MSNSLNTVGWAIIGTPDGMQTKNGGCIVNFDLARLVDLDNLVIKPFVNSEIFCIYREMRGGSIVHYFVLYNHAKEIKTDRPGTFYGSVLVLVNHLAKAEYILLFLRELSGYLASFLLHPNNVLKQRLPA